MTHPQSVSYKGMQANACLVSAWDLYNDFPENMLPNLPTAATTLSDVEPTEAPPPPRYLLRVPAQLPITNNKHERLPSSPQLAVFDELEKLRADETRFRAGVAELRAMTTVRERESIAQRLENLLADFRDDYGRCLDTESLRTLIALLVLHPALKRPFITATEKGFLFSEWRSEDQKRLLSLQMLPAHRVRFVAYQPATTYPHLRKHSSGVTSVEELFSDLASYDILAWAQGS